MPSSLLCETVTGRSMAELIAARDAATGGDMVEIRLDGIPDVDVARALRGRRVPAIVTCRPVWEGGRFDGSEENRAGMLEKALALGAEYVDVEWRTLGGPQEDAFPALIARDPARIVVSSHDFEGVPADLTDRVRQMRATGAAVVKVAVTPDRLSETLPLVDIARAGDAVVIGMGDAGIPTRLLATRYGSKWTYAGHAVAPGQIPADRMVREFRFRSVRQTTRLFGVISSNAMHSVSPAMHNAAFDAAGIDAVYVPLRAADFDDFLEFSAGMGIEGASVTIPFKIDALAAAGQADDLTRRVGAANTLRRRGPAEAGHHIEWEATNTDVAGFLAPLEPAFGRPLDGARAAVLGAGGSARAVVVALLSRGARVSVHARRREQALDVIGALGSNPEPGTRNPELGSWTVEPGSWDILVNCTPLGGPTMRDESPIPPDALTGRLVCDLTYGPGESRLMRDARAAGCLAIDGLPMLVAQAERQFEWWTGQRPAAGVMRDAAYARVNASGSHIQRAAETQKHGMAL